MDQLNDKKITSRHNKTQMLEMLDEYDKTKGMTIKEFCKLRQISEGSFYTARKRYRARGRAKKQSSGFIAITSPALKEPAGSLFAEVNGIRLYQAVPAEYLKALLV
jgi:hypothetical protein